MFRLFMLLALLSSISTLKAQQSSDTVRVSSRPAPKYRGANPHIKSDAPTTDKVTYRRRSASGEFVFDNWTNYSVKAYIDGVYRGTVDAWGVFRIWLADGDHDVYLVSVGGTREWKYTITIPRPICIRLD